MVNSVSKLNKLFISVNKTKDYPGSDFKNASKKQSYGNNVKEINNYALNILRSMHNAGTLNKEMEKLFKTILR